MKKITDFQKRVYQLVKKIPKGKTTSYKAIADKLKTSPRAVGQALKRNPYAPRIPCHRVICSDGKIGGYAGNNPKNIKKKIELLKKEKAIKISQKI
jgi:methylated-DNA-[protein]-cysteine S-methyltransferase